MPTFLPTNIHKFCLGFVLTYNEKVTISTQEMATTHQIKEESPYKPEAFDSRLKRGIAHVSAHKEIQG